LDYDLASRFGPFLAPGETVRWVGRPKQGIAFRPADLLAIPFSIMWCGFAIFWEVAVIASGAPFFFMIWGAPFVLVGLYIVFGRFNYDAHVRSRTLYALTEQNAFILGGRSGDKLKAIDLRTLGEISLRQSGGGRGSITFGAFNPMTPNLAGWPGITAPAEFFAIEGASDVYGQIQKYRQLT
jgi:hypothetical protein